LFWLLPQFLLLLLALLDRATNAIQHGVARCSAVAIELTGLKADAVPKRWQQGGSYICK
jgi:hypothetical protein